MILWRISNYADLHGTGGIMASARWHTQGRRIVYLAESPAAAMLEILVHAEVDIDHLPATYKLLKIEAEDGLPFDIVEPSALPSAWAQNESLTRARGDAWLKDSKSALFRVPSAVMPDTSNWLLNPAHPEASRVRVLESTDHAYNARFFRNN